MAFSAWAYQQRIALLLVITGVAGCAGVPDSLAVVENVVSPYRMDMVQGNVVTREQVDALKPGMAKSQVRDILGTPLLASVFHADRWDFVFTLNRQGVEPQSRHFAVYFKGDVLDHFDAADLPREAEFVASLKSIKELGKLPAMDATPESLQAFAPAAAPAATSAVLPTGVVASYPPLEPRKP